MKKQYIEVLINRSCITKFSLENYDNCPEKAMAEAKAQYPEALAYTLKEGDPQYPQYREDYKGTERDMMPGY